jgi:hypothetical protein
LSIIAGWVWGAFVGPPKNGFVEIAYFTLEPLNLSKVVGMR